MLAKISIVSLLQINHQLNKIIDESWLILITISIFNSVCGYEIAKLIKNKKNIPIVFCGMHATLFPGEAINCGDYVPRGEVEDIIIPFLENIKNDKLERTLGLTYKVDDTVFQTSNAIPPDDINIMPGYVAVLGYKKTVNTRFDNFALLNASRGCTYKCQFCGIIKGFGNQVRYKSKEG